MVGDSERLVKDTERTRIGEPTPAPDYFGAGLLGFLLGTFIGDKDGSSDTI